ncbi:response regulator [Candidatus Woesearchaeota archaeon]|nr:response regulator [Candidatus Woesearchaeota archaeon]
MSKKHVLVADDDSEILEIMVKVLGAKYDVNIASDIPHAIELLQKDPLIVISNKQLPDSYSGLYFAEKVREHDAYTPFILLTTKPELEDEEVLTKHRFMSMAIKPIRSQDLCSIVETELGAAKRAKMVETRSVEDYTGPETVLVVDDDRDVRKAIAENMFQNGFRVTTAKDHDTALAKIQTNLQYKVGVVITDKVLGGEDGIGLAKLIKQTYPLIEIVMLTGNAEVGDYSRTKGVVAKIFEKPTSGDVLLDTVNRLLKKRYDEITYSRATGQPAVWGLVGPEGTGKTSTANGLELALPYTRRIINAVTRRKYKGEIDKFDHYFLTPQELAKQADNYMIILNHQGQYDIAYPHNVIENTLARGEDVLITIKNLFLAGELQRFYPEMKTIKINTPSWERVRRIEQRGRGTASLDYAYDQSTVFGKYADFFDFHIDTMPATLAEFTWDVQNHPGGYEMVNEGTLSRLRHMNYLKTIQLVSRIIKDERNRELY